MPNRITANKIQTHIKKKRLYNITILILIPAMQGSSNIYKLINETNHINELKDKNHIIISIDAENV